MSAPAFSVRHTHAVYALCFSPDGRFLATGSQMNIRVLDVSTGRESKSFYSHAGTIFCLAFSSDGTRLAAGGDDNNLRLWKVNDAAAAAEVASGHDSYVAAVTWSESGTFVATGSYDAGVRVWEASTRKTLKVLAVSFSQDERLLVSVGEDDVGRVWNWRNGQQLGLLDGHTASVQFAAFCASSKLVVTVSMDNTVRVWDADNRVEKRKLKTSHTALAVGAVSRHANVVVTADNNTVRASNYETGQETTVLVATDACAASVAVSPDGRWIAVGSQGGRVTVWAHTQAAAPPAMQADPMPAAAAGTPPTNAAPAAPPANNANGSRSAVLSPEAAPQVVALVQRLRQERDDAVKRYSVLEKQLGEHIETILQLQLITARQQETIIQHEDTIAQLHAAIAVQPEQRTVSTDSVVKQLKQTIEEQRQQLDQYETVDRLRDTPYLAWTVDEMCKWLKGMHVDPHLIAIVAREKIRGDVVARFANDQVLRDLGIVAAGERAQLLSVFNTLLSAYSSDSSVPAAAPVPAPMPAPTPAPAAALPRQGSFAAAPAYVQMGPPTVTTANTSIDISEADLFVGKMLTGGNFGRVYQGTFKGAVVAIKRPNNVTEELRREFVNEARLMKSIPPHPNMVQYYGVCLAPNAISLVMEFCHLGSLETYLRQNTALPETHLINIGVEIAAGMAHLSDTIVHRDLATRNILLVLAPPPYNVAAKVADFGLSRRTGAYEFYDRPGRVIPEPWTPDEVVIGRQPHTPASDVWMFATLLWEMFMGIPPDRQQVPTPKRQSFPPLSCPARCPGDVYAIMSDCWQIDPSTRPVFRSVHKDLQTALAAHT